VKECLEDYYVLKYMEENMGSGKRSGKMVAENILPLIQLFPTSSVFYIVYGMAVEDTKLKIAAFLKCIQIDRESPISVDLLASLYLKEKDYLTACKLFLKSLEIDLFNTKSYVGLCTCLYVLIASSMKRGSVSDK
jgi:tetratricopeptide (TPR) repeat protein